MSQIPEKREAEKLSVLFLCRKYYYLHKMSRVRFHAVRAIGELCSVTWSGPEWENWDDQAAAYENLKTLYKGMRLPDIVLCFKPEEIPGITDLPLPTAVNLDEMQTFDNPAEKTAQELSENKIDLVISHQKKQLDHPLFDPLPCHFAYIPYCADTAIFRDYGQKKDIDVLLIGNLAGKRYPLREKMHRFIMRTLSDPRFKQYKVAVYPYPGYRLKEANTDAHVIDYAKLINASKICMTCSGVHRLKYAKYVEVPACRSLLMADMPGEDREIVEQYLAEIPPDISYEDFAGQVLYYLENESERKRLTDAGYNIVKDSFTQMNYAHKFVSLVEDYLDTYGPYKRWD